MQHPIQSIRGDADKWLFFVLLVLGVAAIPGLKHLGFDQLVVTAVLVGFILVYAASIIAVPRFRLGSDQAADNCYYLGFLYTLTSLAFSLHLFAQDAEQIQGIIANFGIALVTTIVGIAGRILINVFGGRADDPEREARLSLAAASRELRAELRQVVLEMGEFRRATRQSVSDGMMAVAAEANACLEDSSRRVGNVVDEVATKLETLCSAFAGQVGGLERSSVKAAAALERACQQLQDIRLPENALVAGIEPALSEFAASLHRLRERIDTEEQYAQRLHAALEPVLGAAGGICSEVGELQRVAAEASTVLMHARDVGDKGIREAFEALSHAASQQKALTEQNIAASTGLSRTANDNLDACRAAHERLLGELRQAGDETLTIVRRHNVEMESELKRARVTTHAVETSLASMVGLLVEKLGPRRASEA
jgi:hypothetical protein